MCFQALVQVSLSSLKAFSQGNKALQLKVTRSLQLPNISPNQITQLPGYWGTKGTELASYVKTRFKVFQGILWLDYWIIIEWKAHGLQLISQTILDMKVLLNKYGVISNSTFQDSLVNKKLKRF